MSHRVSFLALCVVGLAAAARGDGLYLSGEFGPSFFSDADLSAGAPIGEARFDPGFHIGGAVGFRFLELFRAEANLSYRQGDLDEVRSGGVTLSGAGEAGVFAGMANGYVDLELGGVLHPYIGGGIGFGVVGIDSRSGASALIVDDTSAEFAWNIMAGVSLPITSHFSLNAGYRYFSTTDASLEATVIGVGSGELDAEIGIHEVVLGARVEF